MIPSNGLKRFLMQHSVTANNRAMMTNTRIPAKKGEKGSTVNVKGGSYCINKESEAEFYELYYDHVFKQKEHEHLTEKQIDNGPL